MDEYSYQHRKNWDEFQWEEEIRRDEQRISCYFRELSGCLDLPGEEELILNNISATSSDPVIHNWSGSSDSSWHNIWSDDENNEDEEDEDNSPTEEDESDEAVVNMADTLAADWNLFMVSKLRNNLFRSGLGIACAYGKLLSRLMDYREVDSRYRLPLKLSLGKRALGDITHLLKELPELAKRQKSLHSLVEMHFEQLLQIREELLNRMEQLRRL